MSNLDVNMHKQASGIFNGYITSTEFIADYFALMHNK